MKLIKHGNGHLDHVTTTVRGTLPRIYRVIRKYEDKPRCTKLLKNGDTIIGYIDPGENEIILEESLIYEE